MSTITYDPAIAAKSGAVSAASSKAAPGKGFWSRVLDRLIEARMKQAIAEIRRYGVILPQELEEAGISAKAQDKGSLPFMR